MSKLRKIKGLILVFAVVALFTAALTTAFADKAEASRKCCFRVMVCTIDPPIVCWEECLWFPCY